ncbi:mevalonate kinase [Methanococcus aeolicus Nankai-3]|uniref:Mevalonate kinase n=1 Tax=Methanococcus aeolicus (strain ATCC BAA-1280 / DSM 17508 / OCM 812 / Nankai-3) TaxID=419665 RepID=A6UV36_META3|nr:mevalonate kinase [Methanococcus aeolicus]ABR56358.1 mevalonate kinase [Methanococcus aeolicus Nankai-3]
MNNIGNINNIKYDGNNNDSKITTIETPSKVILFGEHAVVGGYMALSMAVDLKISGLLECYDYIINNQQPTTPEPIIIDLIDLNKKVEINPQDILNINLSNYDNDLKYVASTLKNTVNYLMDKNLMKLNPINNNIKPFKLTITSNIPISCGLGSSASIIITIIKSILTVHNLILSKEEISKIAYTVEKEVQGIASITDTSTIIYGGALKIKDNKIKPIENNDFNNLLAGCQFLIVHSERRIKKTAELVNEVAKHPQKRQIFKQIGEIVEKAEFVKNKEELGKLMVENHKLLNKLGVSTEKLNKIVEIGQKLGYGAKLSGAGGGGIAIILINENKKEDLLNELNDLGVLGIYDCIIKY